MHAGPAIVGNFGGSRLFDYTAYGDTINTAARLEAAKKQLGTRMCVSAAVARRAERFRGRPIGDLLLRGRTEALRTFEPLVPEEDETSTTSMYLDAFSKLEANESGAMSAFAALVGMREVYRARLVRHRIESYAASAAGESWFCRTAAGVWNPCRSMSQVVL